MTDLVQRLRDGWPHRGSDARIMCEEAAAELERMESVCDSYADENQRFHEEIERLRKDAERNRSRLQHLYANCVSLPPKLADEVFDDERQSVQLCVRHAVPFNFEAVCAAIDAAMADSHPSRSANSSGEGLK